MDGAISSIGLYNRNQTYPTVSDKVCSSDVICEGYLHKRSRERSSQKSFFFPRVQKRYILLTNDALYYYHEKVSVVDSEV